MVVRTENVIQSTLPRGDHSLSGVYFQNRNTSNMNQNTAARAKTIKRRNEPRRRIVSGVPEG